MRNRAPGLIKMTVAERRAEKKFRAWAMALPPGTNFEWFDMDFWVFVNFRDYTDDEHSGLTVVCMSTAQDLEVEGWLAYQAGCSRDNGDYYYRTDKTPPLDEDTFRKHVMLLDSGAIVGCRDLDAWVDTTTKYGPLARADEVRDCKAVCETMVEEGLLVRVGPAGYGRYARAPRP
jgi:hypothetical protein